MDKVLAVGDQLKDNGSLLLSRQIGKEDPEKILRGPSIPRISLRLLDFQFFSRQPFEYFDVFFRCPADHVLGKAGRRRFLLPVER